MKRRNLIIVDDFLDNPDAVREYALEQQFERLGGKNWPGRDSSATHGEEEILIAGLHKNIKKNFLMLGIVKSL